MWWSIDIINNFLVDDMDIYILYTRKTYMIKKEVVKTGIHFKSVYISKSMVRCKINVDTDFTDYTDFHNHYQSVSQNSEHYGQLPFNLN